MSRKYVYIRDENGKIIGRTFDINGPGGQRVISVERPKKESTSYPAASSKVKEQQLPALGLMLQWLKEDIISAFFQYSRSKSMKGTAAAALALVLALFCLFSGGTLSILNILSFLLFLCLGVSLFLRKQTLTVWLCILLVGQILIEVLTLIIRFFLPVRVLLFRFFLCHLLDAATFLLLSLLAKTRYGKGKGDFLWVVPTVLQALRCICSVTLYSMIQTLFVYLAAGWLVEPYQENGL